MRYTQEQVKAALIKVSKEDWFLELLKKQVEQVHGQPELTIRAE